ncbi:MAG: bifunctional [glutamine synthetase] adenylyltransferase/[glutamine synthetase]-adenylyl-L-tyrosine phosphorylase [Alphaproteobacteria bacterium]
MQDLAIQLDSDKIPRPFDQSAAEAKLGEWTVDVVPGIAGLDRLMQQPGTQALLCAVFGNSPFLCVSLFKEPDLYCQFLTEGPDRCLEAIFNDLSDILPTLAKQDEVMRSLRIGKRRIALLTALADMAGLWSLEQVTDALSRFAGLAIDYAVAHLVRTRMQRGDLAWMGPEDAPATPEIARASGYIVLAMGKLGAGELNYSSDVDLIVLFDPEVAQYTGRRDVQDCFIRITRDLVKVLQERTQHGYVFRTDLRLRPDAGATAVALSVDAAEIYYQSMGLNWERAAMIKARPIAGDLNAGKAFLERIRGFVWRKHLDYAALEDIYAMKGRIKAHHQYGDIAVAGHDVKLGPGGIREIEFFAQAQQLIAGGRDDDLRTPRTLDTLSTLAAKDIIEASEAHDLTEAYGFLRTLEHRLQMVHDEQTQIMPEDDRGIAAIATFMGFNDRAEFDRVFLAHLRRVEELYDALFDDTHSAGTEPADKWNRLYAAETDPTFLYEEIGSFGFESPETVASTLRTWETGRYRAFRTERARTVLRVLTPTILEAFGDTAEPDRALSRFNEFLGHLPSGVQILTLLQANPNLLDLLANVLGTAPALAEFLGRNHLLLDSVLDPDFLSDFPDARALKNDLDRALAAARDFQDVMDLSRRWANERKFQIGVQLLRQSIDAKEAAEAHTRTAETIIQGLLPAVEEDFARRHGRISDCGLVVVGMGSFGGHETSFTSDLDMIFIYDAPSLDAQSDGERRLPAPQYFARLSQRLINGLTALTGEGRLYEVDMRLRPSGNAGPVAVSVEAFTAYQDRDAWTWEHMALTRARPVAGSETLQAKVADVICDVLSRPRDADALLKTVADMRRRLAGEFGTVNPWNVKHVSGGLLDLEFMAQYLQLKNGHDHPDVFSPRTETAITGLRDQNLIDRELASDMLDAIGVLEAVRGVSRQCLGGDFDPERHQSKALRRAFARSSGYDSFADLEAAVLGTQQRVAEIFETMIVTPDSALSN